MTRLASRIFIAITLIAFSGVGLGAPAKSNAGGLPAANDAIEALQGDVSGLESDLSGLAADVAENSADIAANDAEIAANASDIAANSGAISSNASAISANGSAVADLRSDVDANAADIAALQNAGVGGGVQLVDLSLDDSIVNAAPSAAGQLLYDLSSRRLIVATGTDGLGDWWVLGMRGSSPYHFLIDPVLEMIEDWIGEGPKVFETCYDRTLDGASSATFHTQCDGKGPTVTLIRMVDGTTIGGYNSNSWSSNGWYQQSSTNFLFSITDGAKYPITSDSRNRYATYNYTSYGPTFGGGHDLYINSSMTNGYCYPYSYQGQDRNTFCGSYNSWSIESLLVLTVSDAP